MSIRIVGHVGITIFVGISAFPVFLLVFILLVFLSLLWKFAVVWFQVLFDAFFVFILVKVVVFDSALELCHISQFDHVVQRDAGEEFAVMIQYYFLYVEHFVSCIKRITQNCYNLIRQNADRSYEPVLTACYYGVFVILHHRIYRPWVPDNSIVAIAKVVPGKYIDNSF